MKKLLFLFAVLFAALSASAIPNNEIHYTTTDGEILWPNGCYKTGDGAALFGVSIESNTYSGYKGVITFSGPVTKVDDEAFKLSSRLRRITLPSTVTSIGSHAFEDCNNLYSIDNFEKTNVTLISYDAFANCASLELVKFPNTLVEIEQRAFKNTALASVYIPNSVKTLHSWAFYDCRYLNRVEIGTGIEEIKAQVFSGNTNLFCINMNSPKPPVHLHGNADPNNDSFYNISNGKSALGCYLKVPASGLELYRAAGWDEYLNLNTIEKSVIRYTSTDGDVVWPVGVYDAVQGRPSFGATIVANTYNNGHGMLCFDNEITKMGSFQGKTTLKSIVFPEGVTDIWVQTFKDCSNLETVSMNLAEIEEIQSLAFENCSNLTSFSIPSTVTYIGSFVFTRSGLTEIKIPDNVQRIDHKAFAGCAALTKVELGNGLKSLGQNIFELCPNLASITTRATTPPAIYTGEKCYIRKFGNRGLQAVCANRFADCIRRMDHRWK